MTIQQSTAIKSNNIQLRLSPNVVVCYYMRQLFSNCSEYVDSLCNALIFFFSELAVALILSGCLCIKRSEWYYAELIDFGVNTLQ